MHTLYSVPRAPYFDAVYLHARSPADARVAFFSEGGLEDVDQHLPADLLARSKECELEVLIRRAPSQWHLFQPNWPSDPGYSTPEPILPTP